MKINILINNKSYIPEAYAYKRYLDGLNHQTTLLNLTEIQKADLVIEFMGFKPFYEKFQKNTKYIHEYGSLSIPPFSFIKNKNLSQIKEAQRIATENIFSKKKIPFRTIEIVNKNEQSIGEIFTFFMLETILLGRALKVNPFDQPSVELIKKETKKIIIRG